MKEKKEIVCKITKNRFAGRTDTWMMNIDYNHMRFNDMIVQDASFNVENAVFNTDDEIKRIQLEKLQQAESFAKQEVKDIFIEDIQKIQNSKTGSSEKDPFDNDIEKLYADLGI